MGCASSTLLEDDDGYDQMGGPSGLGHHIVSLTSTTYGLLSLDSPQTPPPIVTTTAPNATSKRLTLASLFPSPLSEPRSRHLEPEIINSWELMAGLDNDSFRFSPAPRSSLLHTVAELDSRISWPPKPFLIKNGGSALGLGKENTNSPICFARTGSDPNRKNNVLKSSNPSVLPKQPSAKYSLEGFEKRCPPGGENAVVVYTTTLRGIRKTFEECNAVRAAFEGVGVWFVERDVSMDLGFREELRELMKGAGADHATVPRVFVRGRYVGGAEEVLRIQEEGGLGMLVEGLPKARVGVVCDGCGGVRFLPCFKCWGSCKVVKEDERKMVRCPDCNENGLVLCPICS